jgi:ketosteroid isomerase-like protein
MSQDNVEIVRRYYLAWNAGGIDAARAFWSDEIEWHDAPEMPDSGVYRGAESVVAHFRDLSGVLGEMEVDVDRLSPSGEEVLVLLHVHLDTQRGGLLLDGPIYETVRIEEGKISRIRLFLDEREALAAAGLRE